MKSTLSILFVFMMAQLSWAQMYERTQAPVPTFESKDQERSWYKEFEKVVMASNAVSAVNADAKPNSQFKPNKRMLKEMATSTSTIDRWADEYYGRFTLVNVDEYGQTTITETGDTAMSVVMTDFSVWAGMKDEVEETNSSYWAPTTIWGTNQIIQRIDLSSSEEGEGVAGDANDSTSSSSDASILGALKAVDQNANVAWVIPDSSFFATMNGETYLFQKKDGVFSALDPNEPKVLSLGKTGLFGLGREQMVLVTKDIDGVWGPSAMNVKHAPKRGVGVFAGYPGGTYINGGSWGPASYGYYNQGPFGGGFGNNWGGGFGGGLSFGFGWGVNSGFGASFGCVPPPVCHPCSGTIGGGTVWNGFSHVNIDWLSSGMGWTNDPYYNGYGGWKSNAVINDSFEDVSPSAEFKKGSTASSSSHMQGESFADITPKGPQKEVSSSKQGNIVKSEMAERAPVMVKAPTHGGNRETGNGTANKPSGDKKPVTVSRPTHGGHNSSTASRGTKPGDVSVSKEPLVRGEAKPKPASGVSGRSKEPGFAQNRQGSGGIQATSTTRVNVPAKPSGNVSRGHSMNQPTAGVERKQPQMTQQRATTPQPQTYGNTNPSRGGAQVGRTITPVNQAPAQRSQVSMTRATQNRGHSTTVQPQQGGQQRVGRPATRVNSGSRGVNPGRGASRARR